MPNIRNLDRRSYLKRCIALGAVTLGSISIIKLFPILTKYDPQILLKKKDVIAELADTIIPRTETPGAKDAGVEKYIISIVLNCYDAKQQQVFLGGLARLETFCDNNFGHGFKDCNLKERNEVMTFYSEKSVYDSILLTKIRNKLFGFSFYSMFRELTIEGFCSSHIGATKGLAYDYIPGSFQACVPIKYNQLSWATK